MRIIAVLALSLIMASCAHRGARIGNSISMLPLSSYVEQLVYLDTEEESQERIDRFIKRNPRPSEKQKIQFLLTSINSSGATMIRNGDYHPAGRAVRWLERKWRHPRLKSNPIASARDFIARVATKSNTTGRPYLMLGRDGKQVRTEQVLTVELDALEAAIQASVFEAVVYAQEIMDTSKLQEAIPTAFLIPAA